MNVLINDDSFYLREAIPADAETMLSIEKKTSPQGWSRTDFMSSITSSHNCQVLTKCEKKDEQLSDEVGAEIAAYIITSTAADEAELLNIVVAPTYQRQGIASRLLELIFTSFDKSIHSLFLEVRASNQAAFTLYDSLGFNEVGVRPNYYPALSKSGSPSSAREDAIIMAKAL